MSMCILISLVLASAVSSIELGCGDYSYNLCHDPPANQELHVGSLEECIQNCDLFATFGQCDYLLYWEAGPDENCKIISGPGSAKEEMDNYLNACGVIGQPLTSNGFKNGTCIEGPNNECSATCTEGCQDCSADSCNGYRETQCLMQGNPGEHTNGIPEYISCMGFCIGQMTSNPFKYVTFDQESNECTCYEIPDHKCSIQVVIQGMTFAEATACHV